MFGECHAHIIMDGVNYRHAVDMHKNGSDDKIIREQECTVMTFIIIKLIMNWHIG